MHNEYSVNAQRIFSCIVTDTQSDYCICQSGYTVKMTGESQYGIGGDITQYYTCIKN